MCWSKIRWKFSEFVKSKKKKNKKCRNTTLLSKQMKKVSLKAFIINMWNQMPVSIWKTSLESFMVAFRPGFGCYASTWTILIAKIWRMMPYPFMLGSVWLSSSSTETSIWWSKTKRKWMISSKYWWTNWTQQIIIKIQQPMYNNV